MYNMNTLKKPYICGYEFETKQESMARIQYGHQSKWWLVSSALTVTLDRENDKFSSEKFGKINEQANHSVS